MKLPFDRVQLRFLKALAEALFDDFEELAIPFDQVVDNVHQFFALVGGTKAKEIGASLRLAELAMAPFFTDLSVEARKERIKSRMQNTQFDAFQDMAKLRSILYFGYYGHWIDPIGSTNLDGGQSANKDNPVLRQIGFTLPKFRTRGPGEVPLERVNGREIAREHVVPVDLVAQDIDVIVVGSGSGGAVSAHNLARRGYKVLVIEAGPFHPSQDITHEERAMVPALFKHGALQSTRDNDFIVFQGRNVGGSPTINNGICLRMKGDRLSHPDAADVFAKWAEIGAPIDEARFMASYDALATDLGLAPAEPRSGKTNGTHLIRGWDTFAAGTDDPWFKAAKAGGWVNKNFGPPGTPSACAYCGYCNTGCPYGRKMGMGQTYLPWACNNHGTRILAETKVEKILWSRGTGAKRRATGVLVVDNDGAPHVIQARKGVVVAAGTIASSLLLERSGIGGTGHQISLNVASPIIALMPEGRTPAWDEDQMTSVVDCGQFLLESHFQPPLSMSSMMPGWFGEMDKRMRAYNRICSAGILFPADRRGNLVGGKLDVKLTLDDIHMIRRAAATLVRVHFAAGALEVYPALMKGQTLTPAMDIDAFYRDAVKEADDITLSSSHPQGGNPMHEDPNEGVVDLQCRLHGADNVLVTDASVFPSCIRVNAQYTTMAMAHYATGYGDVFA
ncbi:GMC family oxidoreductase [Novosphingobium sp.]|uniref:GMC family oxidoreductase n=1 Tax=Novosphingobium sp. TaxID=1874826 RepID=UPI00286A3280|nr:GMC family oxidoreductase [Novosphingobium sp.]